MSEENKEAWVQTQQKTFTKWVNNHLKKKGFNQMNNAQTDFEDGQLLMHLINALYDLPIPKHNTAPKMRPHKLDNIELALKMVDDAKIKTNFLKPTHLIDHDLKMILGMMWSIILDYAIKGISEDDTTAKEGLLLWVRKKTAGYRDVDPPSVSNFTTHWTNGLAFCALIHKHQPHLINYDSLDKSNGPQNLELAFSVAESLGIPRLLDVEDLNTDKPDERSIMTQVSEYFHRFAQQDVKEVAARRAAHFLEFTKNMNRLKHDYENAARELLLWVQSVMDRFDNENWGSTLEEALAINERLRNFIIGEKPEKTAQKMDLENKYAEIQTQLKVNNRPHYDCPAEVSPEALDGAFDALWNAEKSFAQKARQHRFGFIKKEETKLGDDKIQEFIDSYKHFDKDNDGKLDPKEFQAAMSALSIPFRDDAHLKEVFTQVSQGADHINQQQWIKYNTEFATDKDTPEQIKASFKILANDSDKISEDQLRVPPLTQEDIEYLKQVMPTVDGKLDYNSFVDASFVQQ